MVCFFVGRRKMVMSNMNYNFDFYYGNEAEQFNFYRIPKQLFTDKRFFDISTEAKVLYGLLLDRMSLSIKNNWLDEENRVYIYFKIDEAMEYMNICKEKAVRLFAELDDGKGCGLIVRKRQGLGKPSVIYVMNFSSKTTVQGGLCEENTGDFQRSEKQTSGGMDSTDFKKSEIPTSGGSENRLQEVGNSDSNNTEYNNTDFNETESILSELEVDKIDRMLRTQEIKKNIDYAILIKTYPKDDIDGLLNIIVDGVCSKKPYLVIEREKVPKTIVADRLSKLTKNHIEYVMDSLKTSNAKIRNIKNYMLTMLYNSVSTIGSYYRAEVNYDMRG